MYRGNIVFATLTIAFVTFSLTIGFSEGITSRNLKVKLKHGGQLIGRHLTSQYGRNVRAFLGIPYAKAPVGELRLRAPEPFGKWNGTRMAITETPKCMQVNQLTSQIDPESSEDCLYLNVYIPEEPATKKPLPVMVWIYGGFFERGAAKAFNPKYFMDRDVVFVNFNYRLGILGFLSSETEECPGNFGLKDQNMALKWVKENIAAFGGDPNEVTLFGQSAGSVSVSLHTVSELSKGLFHRAITQSGVLYDPWGLPPLAGVPSSKARKLAEMMACDTSTKNWTNIIECLRGISAFNLTQAVLKFAVSPFAFEAFPPVVEPVHPKAFLTEPPRVTPYSNSIPMIVGYNHNEGLMSTTLVLNNAGFKSTIRQQLPLSFGYFDKPQKRQEYITKAIMDYYLKDGATFNLQNYDNVTDMVTDNMFLYGFRKYIIDRLKGNAPTYAYTFDHKGFASWSEYFGNPEQYMGSCHDDDLIYLFPVNEDIFPTSSPTERDIQLRQYMIELWYTFASTGNPTPAESTLPTWYPVKSYPPKLMRLGNRSEKGKLLQMTNNFPAGRAEFWSKLQIYDDQLGISK